MSSPIIDTHQHFWDLSTGTYPWMAGDEMRPLRRNFGPQDLQPLLVENGISATIVVQCRHDLAETRDLLAIAAAYDVVIGVVGWVDLEAVDVPGQIAALRALPGGDKLVGIRHNVHDEPDGEWLCRPGVQAGVAAVISAGLTFDLLVRSRELPAATGLVRRYPQGRFVLDHLAKPPIAEGFSPAWHQALEALAQSDNVWCKVSGLVTEAAPGASVDTFDPYTHMALSVFGEARLLFGSDWPVCTLAATYAEVKAIAERLVATRPELAARFFHLNAIDAYNLG
ncbi:MULTISPECIES: amidohydrolase [unclassified Pseudomonas]|uniref:amidohydrolase family protein n=1 Tax=unclassified Pseudomonas TaxID=196821 RepID=UPI0015A0E446|nr:MULTISPECIES: amidohydrolase family protein [unclassified Pseudomonas]NWC92969.1 amidohydrolase family protein [Pseudomonas sp. IPO3779]NWD19387.1 amidohydrolase family protein [Pseudomonas sp. IPO3778]